MKQARVSPREFAAILAEAVRTRCESDVPPRHSGEVVAAALTAAAGVMGRRALLDAVRAWQRDGDAAVAQDSRDPTEVTWAAAAGTDLAEAAPDSPFRNRAYSNVFGGGLP
jgi:hypothetical protein